MPYACPVKLPLGKRLSRFNWGSLRHALRGLIIYKTIVKSYTYLGRIYVTQGAELCKRSNGINHGNGARLTSIQRKT